MGTILGVVALILAGIALAHAWRLGREMERLVGRLDRYNRALFDANHEIQRLQERQAADAAALKAAIVRAGGRPSFAPEMTVREAQALHPLAQSKLATFHVGGCGSCAADPEESLLQVCRSRGLDVATVLGELNQLFAVGKDAREQVVRQPNLQLEL